MSIGSKKHQILHILSQNLSNPQPELVRSDVIARQLQLSLPETELLLKVMNHMGVIESNVDHRLSLITRKGMEWLQQASV
ncbi:MAG: hypothetical protein PHI97_10555 [Desulfobulbus sp.]|nr:hypothetical protein [Desulfobulbus sp.]